MTRQELKRAAFQYAEQIRTRMHVLNRVIPVYMHYDGEDDFTKHATHLERMRSEPRLQEVATALEEADRALSHAIDLMNKYRGRS